MRFGKFVRENSRTLLMIFMSLLLVAFLIPNTIQNMSRRERPYTPKIGHAFGREIKDRDLDEARADLAVLRSAGLRDGFGGDSRQYYLAVNETQRAGVRVSRDEVKAFLVDHGRDNPLWQQPDVAMQAVQRNTRRSFDEIYDAIGRWLAIDRFRGLQADGFIDTLPRLEVSYRDRTQEAVTLLSVLDTKAFLGQVPQPTDDQLQAFFDECKGRKQAHTEKELVFGYLLPDRVRVEYLTVDPQKIRNAISVQAAQVRHYFEDNATHYTKPDPLATQPVDGKIPQVPQTFEEARDRVREDYRTARAVEVAQSLINDVYIDVHRPWSAAPLDSAGFAPTPPGEPPDWRDLKNKYSTTYEVTYGETGLMDPNELQKVPGLGGAGLRIGYQVLRFPELAHRVKGLIDKDPHDGKPVLNVMEPAVVLTYVRDTATNQWNPIQAYLFRVIEIAPSAPASDSDLTTMREKIVDDWRLLQAHELAKQQAEALAASARQLGLIAAVQQATELKALLAEADAPTSQPAATLPSTATRYAEDLEPFTPQNQLTRSTSYIQGRLESITDIPGIPPAIFDLADLPVDEAAPHHVGALPIANQFRWLVAELIEVKPLYGGPFEKQLATTVEDARRRSQEINAFARVWSAPDYLKERTAFVSELPARPTGDEEPTPP